MTRYNIAIVVWTLVCTAALYIAGDPFWPKALILLTLFVGLMLILDRRDKARYDR